MRGARVDDRSRHISLQVKMLVGFLVGQVMKATQGKASPGDVNRLLKEALEKA